MKLKCGSISRSRFSLSAPSCCLSVSCLCVQIPLCNPSRKHVYILLFSRLIVSQQRVDSSFSCQTFIVEYKKSITADWWYRFLRSPVVSGRFSFLFRCRPSAELSCMFTIKLSVKPELCATSEKLCVQSCPPVIPASWCKRVKTAKAKLVFQFKVLLFKFCCSEPHFLGES